MDSTSDNSNFIESLFENLAVDVVVTRKGLVHEGWQESNLVREYSKLYYFLGGKGEITIEGQAYRPQKGQMMVIPEGVKHSFETDEEDRFLKYYCHFNAKVGGISIFDILECRNVIDIDPSESSLLVDLLDQMIQEYRSVSITSTLYLKSLCLKLVAFYFDHTKVKSRKLESQTLIAMKETVQYIEVHIDSNLSVELLAERCHLHPNYFSQLFKSTYGLPPVKFINNVRMEKAKQLLLTSDISISHISQLVGFLNVHYFSTTFKKYADMSPSNYRKLYYGI